METSSLTIIYRPAVLVTRDLCCYLLRLVKQCSTTKRTRRIKKSLENKVGLKTIHNWLIKTTHFPYAEQIGSLSIFQTSFQVAEVSEMGTEAYLTKTGTRHKGRCEEERSTGKGGLKDAPGVAVQMLGALLN